jgi:hypothetical protein
MTKLDLEFLEVMIINSCNLACQGCTTFSDLKHAGYVPWVTGKSWLEPWTHKLNIKAIGLMGGEPLINPDLKSWILGLRDLLPTTQIRFVTNGLLLNEHWEVIELLEQVGNCVLKISYHVSTPELDKCISNIMAWRNWEPVTESGISRWKSPQNMRFQISYPKKFLKTFQGSYENMSPHDSNPAEAFEICVQKKCPMLNLGRIWKCGTLALTAPLLDRMNRPNWEQWQPFIDLGLDSDCNEQQLKIFVQNFGKPHQLCGQCPTQNDVSSVFDHRSTVKFKKEVL